ncbi:MG2 domain-containing protein [Flavobacterium sp.]|uniref:MG2 domain-containing protein n=1 Tax=Flavobacterium sp. TaxID=239 RepID=UPI002B4B3372|nr:MG2 domain-containing protein [Flavobacterium sp.]HLF52224.1 MG2 domain-containing protein [Flavobacterium sp.]
MKIQKKLFNLFLTVFAFFTIQNIQSQSIEEKIANITSQYFELDRENFHIQFNKSIYLTNESIWFKGFVYDKKNNIPNTETTNIYVILFNPEGKKLDTKLFFAENGVFQGDFKLNNSLKSGKYYLQVYTNWSNNFHEDESSIFRVKIINSNEGEIAYVASDPKIEFHPEGGIFLEGINNTIGISVMDCNNEGLSIAEAKVINEKGEEISSFQTNAFGYGKFEIMRARKENYKIVFTYNNNKIEKFLPLPQENGTLLLVNNFSNEAKTFVSIRTNEQSKRNLIGKNLYLTVNQNDRINIVNFQINENDHPIILSNKDLFDGINVLRIIDENLNQLNERIIYKSHKNNFELNLEVFKKKSDSIQINGISTSSNIKLGISILPEGTICSNNESTIFSSLLLNPYLKNSIPNSNYFFENPSKRKYFDLDLILLNQKISKYEWEAMKKIPIVKYPFNKGLTLKGIINETLDDRKKYKVQLFSFVEGINELADIKENNEFYFNNFIASDSLKVNFTLVKNGEKYKELNYYPQIINNDKPFLKSLEIKNSTCNQNQTKNINPVQIDIPTLKDAIQLNDISIISEPKKPVLTNQDKFGNSMSRGYKIADGDYKMYSNVIQFIAAHGFDAASQAGTVYIKGRTRISITRPNIPSVFLDDVQIYDFDILDNFSLKFINEIFINKNGTNIQSTGSGVIKIYTNKDYRAVPRKSKSKSFLIKNAFAAENIFIMPEYESFDSNGFNKYGTIFWEGNIENEGSVVKLSIPNLNQKSVKILIEGISADGKFISEVKTLSLE